MRANVRGRLLVYREWHALVKNSVKLEYANNTMIHIKIKAILL